MGYLRDDKEDTMEDMTLTARCFAVALGHLLKDTEGIVVEVHPEKTKYIVFNENGQIHIMPNTDDNKLGKTPDGQLLWMHLQ